MVNSSVPAFAEKIMVVDDTSIDRFIAEHLILKTGFAEHVVSLGSAPEALDYLIRFSGKPQELPRIIFLDINMPQFDGFEFLVNYESLDPSVKDNCCIVMLSSSDHPHDIERANNSSYVSHYICKPLNKEKLDGIRKQHAFRLTGNNLLRAMI